MLYETLLNEAYEEGLIVKEKPLQYNDGRIKGNRIAIRETIETTTAKACILAEELGHYHTTVGDILDQHNCNNRKQEYVARKWAYERLVPEENIRQAITDGYTDIWDLAEHLNVDETFLKEALQYYGYLSA